MLSTVPAGIFVAAVVADAVPPPTATNESERGTVSGTSRDAKRKTRRLPETEVRAGWAGIDSEHSSEWVMTPAETGGRTVGEVSAELAVVAYDPVTISDLSHKV
jgi:hypothetical protein